ncbi:hypothetical protein JNK13_00565 [bacterium]|nr:hypothetical protein [bacterium]
MQEIKNILHWRHLIDALNSIPRIWLQVLTIFAATVYVPAANAAILKNDGANQTTVFVGTCLCLCIMSLSAGLVLRRPLVIGPAMGINTFISVTVVNRAGASFEQALAVSTLAGGLLLLAAYSGFAKRVLAAIPDSIQISVVVSLGALLVVHALGAAGITSRGVSGNTTVVTLLCFATMMLGYAFKKHAYVLFGILTGVVMQAITGGWKQPDAWVQLPKVAEIPHPSIWGVLTRLDLVPYILVVALIVLIDLSGTMRFLNFAGYLYETEEELQQRSNQALVLSGWGAICAGLLCSCYASLVYLESITGLKVGKCENRYANAGRVAMLVGVLFLVLSCFRWIPQMVPKEVGYAILIMIGFLMTRTAFKLKPETKAELVGSFFMIFLTAGTQSLALGILLGLLSYIAVEHMERRHAAIEGQPCAYPIKAEVYWLGALCLVMLPFVRV